ncbi:hypothetical protein M011DRAFT_188327 [Sporormia fimetaria CBS 119925]|uniref:Uncharacterized protein n=1 Tax=Sporormia fimetaria CBS 119925 TaxID=1340428 RepID=A0A6A6VP43_9PLEO|nr:hypothetical protein M011DRAFT_188327 [Sporormia fimetaria CBS 119925]
MGSVMRGTCSCVLFWVHGFLLLYRRSIIGTDCDYGWKITHKGCVLMIMIMEFFFLENVTVHVCLM